MKCLILIGLFMVLMLYVIVMFVVLVIQVDVCWICMMLVMVLLFGYFMLKNYGDVFVMLIGIDMFVYGMVMVYEMQMSGSIVKMVYVDLVVVLVYGVVMFKLKSYYVMLEELCQVVVFGVKVLFWLYFVDGLIVFVICDVKVLIYVGQ